MSNFIQTNFFGTSSIKNAIEMLKCYEPEEGYKLGFSGGKDSQVLYWLAKKAEVKFQAIYRLTTVDPPHLVYFIRKYYPDVIIEKPHESMWQLMLRKKTPPTRRIRYCCEVLKERGWNENDKVLTGVRKDESPRRQKWNQTQHCLKGGGYTLVNPMLDFTDVDVWNIIKSNNLPYCKLYDEGFKRLGCIGCPLANWKQREFEFRMFPKYEQAYKRTFERIIIKRKETGMKDLWKNADQLWQWWMYGADFSVYEDPNQLHLFNL
jgi:phosphoadenosine phosphosulfate reductase